MKNLRYKKIQPDNLFKLLKNLIYIVLQGIYQNLNLNQFHNYIRVIKISVDYHLRRQLFQYHKFIQYFKLFNHLTMQLQQFIFLFLKGIYLNLLNEFLFFNNNLFNMDN